jgi:hypothetical protein
MLLNFTVLISVSYGIRAAMKAATGGRIPPLFSRRHVPLSTRKDFAGGPFFGRLPPGGGSRLDLEREIGRC